MANTYYDSQLTAEEIEEVLEAIKGILTQANNGKVLAISNGKIEARSVQWGGDSTLEPLSVTANGDYYPEAGVDGFDEVHVSVPNSYTASDEGKVVSNGALIAQTARATQITDNGTYDTTLNDEVTVNVSGGGSAVVQSLSVTQNGTYNPPSGVDGYAPVTVNVSGGGVGPAVEPALPTEYQEVEYMDFDGNSYIRVPIAMKIGDILETYAMWTDSGSSEEAFLGGVSYNNSRFELYFSDSKLFVFTAGTLSVNAILNTTEFTNINEEHNVPAERNIKYRALIQLLSNVEQSGFNIGRYHDNASYYYKSRMWKVKYSSFSNAFSGSISDFNSNTRIITPIYRWIKPCYRKSDNVPGFYNTYENVFYTNLGTGTLVVGPDVN